MQRLKAEPHTGSSKKDASHWSSGLRRETYKSGKFKINTKINIIQLEPYYIGGKKEESMLINFKKKEGPTALIVKAARDPNPTREFILGDPFLKALRPSKSKSTTN